MFKVVEDRARKFKTAPLSGEQEAQAAMHFETTWPGWTWDEASSHDKKMFRDHVLSLEAFRKGRA